MHMKCSSASQDCDFHFNPLVTEHSFPSKGSSPSQMSGVTA